MWLTSQTVPATRFASGLRPKAPFSLAFLACNRYSTGPVSSRSRSACQSLAMTKVMEYQLFTREKHEQKECYQMLGKV